MTKDAKPGEYLAAQQSTLGSGHGLRNSPPSPSLAFLFVFIDVFFPAEQAAVLGECPRDWALGQCQGDVQGFLGSWDRVGQGLSLVQMK